MWQNVAVLGGVLADTLGHLSAGPLAGDTQLLKSTLALVGEFMSDPRGAFIIK
jgi:hypothetical protein